MFCGHGVTDIYEIETAKMVTSNYVLLDSFSHDFSEQKRSLLSYKESEIS